MINKAIMERILSCKLNLHKEEYDFSIQTTNEVVFPNQVMLPCKYIMILVQDNLRKRMIYQFKDAMKYPTQATIKWSCLTKSSYP